MDNEDDSSDSFMNVDLTNSYTNEEYLTKVDKFDSSESDERSYTNEEFLTGVDKFDSSESDSSESSVDNDGM